MKSECFRCLSALVLLLGVFPEVALAQPVEPAETPPAPPATAAVPPAEPPTEATEPASPPPPAEPVGVPPAPVAAPALAEPPPAAVNTTPVDVAPATMAAEANAPAAEPGPEFLPLAISGSIWSRYEIREGYQEHGLTHPRLHREGDYIVSRARLGFSTNKVKIGEKAYVAGTFVPQAAYTMGTTGAPETILDSPPVTLYEGYATVGSADYKLDVGRFAMDYGDALVIGNLGWNEAARAFNGARVRLTPGGSPYWIDVFATLITEGRGTTLEPVSGDTYFYGAYAGLGPMIAEGFDLDFYLLGQTLGSSEVVDPTDATVTLERESATELTLGGRVKGSASIIDYRAEAGFQFGSTVGAPTTMTPVANSVDKSAYQADGELGVKPVAGLRISAGGFIASGNDPESADSNEGWNELYPTGHKWLGLSDVTGPRTNIAGPRGGVSYGGLEGWVMALDAEYYTRLEQDATGVDGAMGTEFDFNLVHKIGKGAVARAMYAVFLPSEDFWIPKAVEESFAGDPIHFLEIQFGYEFK